MNRALVYLAALLLIGSLSVACKSQEDDAIVQTTTDSTADSLPDATADALSFTDTDTRAGYLSGTLTIDAAEDESTLDAYVLYWGSSSTEKLSGQDPIATKDKVGANLTHTLSATATPSGATYFLVYTSNENGEATTPASLSIVDNDGTTENRFGYAIFGTGIFGP